MSTTPVRHSDIRMDGGTQSRSSIDDATISEYAEAMLAGAAFPPPVVFYDGAQYWLADGFHRLLAMRRNNATDIPCDVRQGTLRDAVLYSVGANAQHGLPRSNADKRRAVELLLRDPEWSQWSNREIARRAAVHSSVVDGMRNAMQVPESGTSAPGKRKAPDGKAYPAARKRATRAPDGKPDAVPHPPQATTPDAPKPANDSTPQHAPQRSSYAGIVSELSSLSSDEIRGVVRQAQTILAARGVIVSVTFDAA